MITFPIRTENNYDNPKLPQKQDKAIQLQAVSKRYQIMKTSGLGTGRNIGELWALKDISFEVKEGEILGIIGRNGAGKTTLLNIIAGILTQTEGEVNVNGKIVGLFNLGVGFQDELTGRENIFLNAAILGATKEQIEHKFDSILDFSELSNFVNLPLGTYSQGMRLRLGFSIIVNLDFDILVIDEVLAVGDTLFQDKCFKRLMDFKRAGKTLIITNQNMDLIERLCDKVILLDHGKLLFYGETMEGIGRYCTLLNTEKFYVGPIQQKQRINLVENTKKWAENIVNWGKKLGTKEVVIRKVRLINRFGWSCSKVKTREPIRIKVDFIVRDTVKEPHFGVAIFRNDGVYCYGPNSVFDGYQIIELKHNNKGYFMLNCPKLLLAPGEYKISVAIWDKNEILAFDYHNGCYQLTITGEQNHQNELLNLQFEIDPRNYIKFKKQKLIIPDLSILKDNWGKKLESPKIQLDSIKFLNYLGEEKNVFLTNESVKLLINFSKIVNLDKNHYLWVGLYRDDGVYCQGIIQMLNKDKNFWILFPKLPLLPGGYRVSFGIWDGIYRKFIMYHHACYSLQMVFNQEDHGTVYLEHTWHWR
jgi:ABC-type polysaccharide/polyol phosphate transport system ATPase subunit